MSDWYSLTHDAQLDYNELLDRINDCDPTLCNEDWKEATIDFDMPYIEEIYQNINVEEMIDIITVLIFNEYRCLYLEGKLDKMNEHLDLVEFKNKLDGFANKRRELLVAKREEKETREAYLKKLKGRKQKRQNSYILSGWGQKISDSTDKTSKVVDSDTFWRFKTQDFDLNVIREFLKTNGSTIAKKMEIVQEIYDAAANTTNLSKLPYSVDKLLSNYRKNREIELQDIIDAFEMHPKELKFSFSLPKDKTTDKETLNSMIEVMKEAIFRQKTVERGDEAYKVTTKAIEGSNGETESEEDDSLSTPDNLPDELNTPKAKLIMQKLVDAGWLTADWQPKGLSNAERGYLADEIAERLKIKAKWKVMAQMWKANPDTLRQANIKASYQKKTQIFIEKIKKVLG
jgi:hypothetical protein